MNARRLLPLLLGVTLLLAVAAVATNGRPLAGGRGRGPTATFFDYFATTLLLFTAAVFAAFLYFVYSERFDLAGRPAPRRWRIWSTMIALAIGALIAVLVLHTHFHNRLNALYGQPPGRQGGQTHKGRPVPKSVRDAHVRWDEIAVVLVLLGGTVAVLVARRRTSRPPRLPPLRAREVALALDESIDDLRTDPDLRRAIVAAYARMETALARAGLPRHAAEAPFEYLERALVSLEAGAGSARRLTALFESAKFSHHEPDPEMRDEAIEALLAVRDDLRRPAEEAIPA